MNLKKIRLYLCYAKNSNQLDVTNDVIGFLSFFRYQHQCLYFALYYEIFISQQFAITNNKQWIEAIFYLTIDNIHEKQSLYFLRITIFILRFMRTLRDNCLGVVFKRQMYQTNQYKIMACIYVNVHNVFQA